MVDDFLQAGRFDAVHQFIRAKGAFPGRTPDIDAFCIQNQDEALDAFQSRTQCVETQRVICTDEDRRIRCRISKCV